MDKKRVKKCAVRWTKFCANENSVGFAISNEYYDKDWYLQDQAKAINDLVVENLKFSSKIKKLLESGQIKNLRITYEIHE